MFRTFFFVSSIRNIQLYDHVYHRSKDILRKNIFLENNLLVVVVVV